VIRGEFNSVESGSGGIRNFQVYLRGRCARQRLRCNRQRDLLSDPVHEVAGKRRRVRFLVDEVRGMAWENGRKKQERFRLKT